MKCVEWASALDATVRGTKIEKQQTRVVRLNGTSTLPFYSSKRLFKTFVHPEWPVFQMAFDV